MVCASRVLSHSARRGWPRIGMVDAKWGLAVRNSELADLNRQAGWASFDISSTTLMTVLVTRASAGQDAWLGRSRAAGSVLSPVGTSVDGVALITESGLSGGSDFETKRHLAVEMKSNTRPWLSSAHPWK